LIARQDRSQLKYVADKYDDTVFANKNMRKKLDVISKRLPVQFWVFLPSHQCFVAFSEKNLFWEEPSAEVDSKLVQELTELCYEYRLALVGTHYDSLQQRIVLEVQVLRPVVLHDWYTCSFWVRIPCYYLPVHLLKSPDFTDLKERLKYPDVVQPGRSRNARRQLEADELRERMRSEARSPREIWDATQKLTGYPTPPCDPSTVPGLAQELKNKHLPI